MNSRGELKKHVRAILTVLAQHGGPRSREAILALAGYVPSGDISTGFAGLLEHQLLASADGLYITHAGLELLGPYDPLPTGAALRAHLLGRLSSAERKLLQALFEFHDQPRSRADIHERAGLKPSGDTSTALAKFLTVGWMRTVGSDLVAADLFFEA